jgi:hypothetical protein
MRTKISSNRTHGLHSILTNVETLPHGGAENTMLADTPEAMRTGGQPVSRREVKDMAIAYVKRVAMAEFLDAANEPLSLVIRKEELETLLGAGQPGECVALKVMLAVEIKEGYGDHHQTIVLMPCDLEGKVIKLENGDPGVERWPFDKNIKSILENGSIENGVEKFLTENLGI